MEQGLRIFLRVVFASAVSSVSVVPMLLNASMVLSRDRNVIGNIVIAYIESLDTSVQLNSVSEELAQEGLQLESTQEQLSQTESVLVSTQGELIDANSQIEEASLLLSGTSIPEASQIDAIVSSLWLDAPYAGSNPPSPLTSQLNDGLIPYLQAILAKMSEQVKVKKISGNLVLTQDNRIYGCGYNGNGQLGIGSSDSSAHTTLIPMILSGIQGTPIDIVATELSSFVLTDSGKVYGCGSNASGHLGIGVSGGTYTTLTPMHLDSITTGTVSAIASFSATGAERISSTYLLINTGDIYACGGNDYGQLGIGTDRNSVPSDRSRTTLTLMSLAGIVGRPTAVAAGCRYMLVLTDAGKVYGCGMADNGVLGFNFTGNKTTLTAIPLPVDLIGTPTAIEVGGDALSPGFSLILTNVGDVYGCGENGSGQLGVYDTNTPYLTLTGMSMFTMSGTHTVALNGKIVGMSAGLNYTMLIADNGNLYATGDNSYGQLGRPSSLTPSTDHLVLGPALSTPTGVTTSLNSNVEPTTHFLLGNGHVSSCGSNKNGEYGAGSTVNTDDIQGLSQYHIIPMWLKKPWGVNTNP